MGVFLDSNFLLSIIHPKDPYSSKGSRLLNELSTGKYGLLYTSSLIIAETATLVAVRTKGNNLILQDLENILWGRDKIAKILRITPEIEKETWIFFKKVNSGIKSKKDFISFVDCSSLQFMKEHQLEAIVSFDEHFDRFTMRIQ